MKPLMRTNVFTKAFADRSEVLKRSASNNKRELYLSLDKFSVTGKSSFIDPY